MAVTCDTQATCLTVGLGDPPERSGGRGGALPSQVAPTDPGAPAKPKPCRPHPRCHSLRVGVGAGRDAARPLTSRRRAGGDLSRARTHPPHPLRSSGGQGGQGAAGLSLMDLARLYPDRWGPPPHPTPWLPSGGKLHCLHHEPLQYLISLQGSYYDNFQQCQSNSCLSTRQVYSVVCWGWRLKQ